MDIKIKEEISKEVYAEIIQDDVSSIERYLNKFLKSNAIDSSQIDSLFLTGGTSLVPSVKQIFEQKFPTTPIHSGDNFISVANGLALSEYLFEE